MVGFEIFSVGFGVLVKCSMKCAFVACGALCYCWYVIRGTRPGKAWTSRWSTSRTFFWWRSAACSAYIACSACSAYARRFAIAALQLWILHQRHGTRPAAWWESDASIHNFSLKIQLEKLRNTIGKDENAVCKDQKSNRFSLCGVWILHQQRWLQAWWEWMRGIHNFQPFSQLHQYVIIDTTFSLRLDLSFFLKHYV